MEDKMGIKVIKKGPRVVISGYYGFDNLGDEAVLAGMLHVLCCALPGLQPVILSHNPPETEANYGRLYGARAVNRWKVKEIVGALREADFLISGGGSLLQDVTGLKSLFYYLGIVVLARLLGKPVIFYGQGIGPVCSWLGRWAVRLVANRVQLILVRDEDSCAELRRLGVKKPPIHVTADAAFALNFYLSEEEKERGSILLRRVGINKDHGPVVGISVRPWSSGKNYLQEVAILADVLVRRGWQVIFLPMQRPGDVAASRWVTVLMKEQAVVWDEPLTVSELLAVMANLDLAVGMRLHFLIFAALAGVPLVGIAYDPKINRFLSSLDLLPAPAPAELTWQEMEQRVQMALASAPRWIARRQQKLQELRHLALRAATLVANFWDNLRAGS